MVVRKNSSIIHNSPNVVVYKNFFKTVLLSSFTITPFDIENTSFGYMQSVVLLSFIASLCSFFPLFPKVWTHPIFNVIFSMTFGYILLFLVLLISAFSFSWLGCKILGLENDPKHFAIISSSFSPFPLLVLLFLIPNVEILHHLGLLACVMLMNYYIYSTYQRYYPIGTDRIRTIFNIFTFVLFYIIVNSTVQFSVKVPIRFLNSLKES